MSATILLHEDREAVMRDGTILRADVFEPAAPGRYPVLLSRTPYDKTRPVYRRVARFMAEHGYVCVLQDIRGTHRSEGTYHLARNGREGTCDAEDGYDSIEWAANLPTSDGRVCIWGHSYSSWSSWVAAPTRPPHLVALFGSGMAASILKNTRGIFETGRRMHWMYQQSAELRRKAGAPSLDKAAIDAQWYDVERFKWVWFLPLGDIPDSAFLGLTPQLRQYMRQQEVESWGFDAVHPDVAVPTCTVTGWYDRIVGAIEQFEGMERNGPVALRGRHRLIVGPWGHGMGNLSRHQGPLDFGPEAETTYQDLLLSWCEQVMHGRVPPDNAPVRLFVMGENRWQAEREWPLARARYTDFFLHGDGHAATPDGDGRLDTTPPGDEPADSYVYDPRDPVMSLMGRDTQMEPRFQAPLDHRPDILVYQSAALSAPQRVIGPVVLKLWIASDAPDTDFTAKLVDVRPDGTAVNLTYGILRCRYREGFGRAAPPLEPGRPCEIEIALNPTAVVFAPGHRIRLDVSSSDFPNFDRNHNTGRDFWSDTELRPARQTVFHEAAYPSRLILPLIPD